MGAATGSATALSIGGVPFLLEAGGLAILQEESEPYRSFLLPPPEAEPPDAVHVHLEVAARPSFEGDVLFSSEATWAVHAAGEERAVVFRGPASTEALWVARFRPGGREVSVLCAPKLVEDGPAGPALKSPFRYPLDQILTMYLLAGRGFVVHAAGFDYRGHGVAFPGVSGAGKTTIARLIGSRPDWTGLSDDRVAVRVDGEAPALYGTPWPGEGRVAVNGVAPMRGLLFLEKGPENVVRAAGAAEGLSRLLQVVSIPWFDRAILPRALAACEEAVLRVPAAVLAFRPDDGAAETAEQAVLSLAGTGRG